MMIRSVEWRIFLSSALLIILLLTFIVTIKMKTLNSTLENQPQLGASTSPSTSPSNPQLSSDDKDDGPVSTMYDDPQQIKDLQKNLEKLFERERYSNPQRFSSDNDDVPVRNRNRTRSPQLIIGKNIDPCKSYTLLINGTLSYVPPCPNTTTSTIVPDDPQKSFEKLYERKRFSNPPRSSTDEDDVPVRNRKRIGSPQLINGKNINPCKSRTLRINGTLSYVPPCPNTTTSTIVPDGAPISNKIEYTSQNPTGSKDTHYSETLIDGIMDKHKHRFAKFFGNDVAIGDGHALGPRIHNVDEQGNAYDNICDSEERLYHPQHGLNMNNTSVMIVNTKQYVQGFRAEFCRGKREPCAKVKSMFKNTECRQFYHFRTLLAIDTKTQEPYIEKIKLPSCCKCVILK